MVHIIFDDNSQQKDNHAKTLVKRSGEPTDYLSKRRKLTPGMEEDGERKYGPSKKWPEHTRRSLPGKDGRKRKKYGKKKAKFVINERKFPYEENELMTRYYGFWIPREAVEKLDQLQVQLKEENIGAREMRTKLMAAKRRAHKDLRMKLMKKEKHEKWKRKNVGSTDALVLEEENNQLLNKKMLKKKKKVTADGESEASVKKTGSKKNKDKKQNKKKVGKKSTENDEDKCISHNEGKENSETLCEEKDASDGSPPNEKRKNKETVKKISGLVNSSIEMDNNFSLNDGDPPKKKLKNKKLNPKSAEKDTSCSVQKIKVLP